MPEQADVIFINARIATLDPDAPEAQAVAVRAGRVTAVGPETEIYQHISPRTTVIDLGGRRVVPGFIDAHSHPIETIWLKNDWVDARFPDTKSVAETLVKLRERVKDTAEGKWIFVACVSATENKFAEKRLPNIGELDAAAPDNPVLVSNGAHMSVINTAALNALGIKDRQTALPKGGKLLLDDSGKHTGVVTDGFADMPASPDPSEVGAFYASGIAEFWNSYGFTSIMAITPHHAVPALQAVSIKAPQNNIRFTVSVWAAPDGEGFPADLAEYEMPAGADPDYYRFLAIKAWVDGENDCRTGWMHEPYIGHFDIDPPGGLGTLVTPQPKADAFADLARDSGRVPMLHCSGDAAVDIGLSAYEQMNAGAAGRCRCRIEHFGMFQLTDSQLQRGKALAAQGLRISVQPIWLNELVKADIENMGEARAKTGFKFKTMIDAGLEPAASTDMTGIYLGNINPFTAIKAVVTRQSDAGLFEPQEAVSVIDAVRMWTVWAARANDEGEHRGTIEVGKLADMAVLSDDIFTIEPDKLDTITVTETIVGGRVVYRRD